MQKRYIGEIIGSYKILPGLFSQETPKGKYPVICQVCGTKKFVWGTTLTAILAGKVKGCKVCRDISYRKTDDSMAVYKLYRSYKYNAKSRNIPFLLSPDDVGSIAKANCYFCDVEPKEKTGSKDWHPSVKLSGIDRVDNNAGYTIENCVACCYDCNRAKSDMPFQDFTDWAKRIAKNEFWV